MEDRLEQPQQQSAGLPVETLVQFFEESEQATDEPRKKSERDRDYYDGNQWTAQELAELQRRKQPPTVANRIKTKIDYLVGFEAAQRQDPRAFPRTPQDEDASEAATDALRYVADVTNLDRKHTACWEYLLVEGYCGLEWNVEQASENQNPKLTATLWHWDRLFYDPHSREADFSDARYRGGVIWMDTEAAKKRWPDAENIVEETLVASQGDTFQDRPHWQLWTKGSSSRKRIRVVQMWYKTGEQWFWCIFTKAGKLAGGPVPFVDEDGKSYCNLNMMSANIDRENNRYGVARNMISQQDEINKRRSKALHMLMSRQVIAEEGAVDDEDQAKRELQKPDGWLKRNKGMELEVVDSAQDLSGQLALMEEAKNEIELLGPNASMQGRGERGASGRAILANQQGGQIELAALFDNYRAFKNENYKIAWRLVRQHWTAEHWVRVTDEEKNVRFVGFNRQITMADKLLEQAEQQGMAPEEAQAILQQRMSDPFSAYQLQQVVDVENVPAKMGMDIILDEVPESANIQQEQFEILANLATSGVQLPPKLLIKASAIRNKKELLDELDKQENNPAAQAASQAQMELLTAQIEKLRAEIGKTRSDAVKTLIEADNIDGQVDGVVVAPVMQEQPPQPEITPDVGFGAPPLDGAMMPPPGAAGL